MQGVVRMAPRILARQVPFHISQALTKRGKEIGARRVICWVESVACVCSSFLE